MGASNIQRIAEACSSLYVATGDGPDVSSKELPRPQLVIEALCCLLDIVLPGRELSQCSFAEPTLEQFIAERLVQVEKLLLPEISRALSYRCYSCAAAGVASNGPADAPAVVAAFFDCLPDVRKLVIADTRAAYAGDPAALTYAEVQLAYPGLLAVAAYRVAHELYRLDVPIVPRLMTEWTHTMTGADIHPGAQIGEGFFIDHATGVVIGETGKIGKYVKLYQGVTLGAKSFPVDDQGNPVKHIQRHPTVEDDVVIYANATVLGGATVIGKGATIGAGVFLMESVPAGSTVVSQHPELRIR